MRLAVEERFDEVVQQLGRGNVQGPPRRAERESHPGLVVDFRRDDRLHGRAVQRTLEGQLRRRGLATHDVVGPLELLDDLAARDNGTFLPGARES